MKHLIILPLTLLLCPAAYAMESQEQVDTRAVRSAALMQSTMLNTDQMKRIQEAHELQRQEEELAQKKAENERILATIQAAQKMKLEARAQSLEALAKEVDEKEQMARTARMQAQQAREILRQEEQKYRDAAYPKQSHESVATQSTKNQELAAKENKSTFWSLFGYK